MTDRFDKIDDEYQDTIARINDKIGEINQASWDDKQDTQQEVKRDIEEAEDLVEQLSLEVRSIASTHRGALSKRCKAYKDEVAGLKKKLQRAMVSGGSRTDLMGDDGDFLGDRQQMQDQTDRLNSTSNRIRHAQQLAAETEMVGMSVVDDLHEQRSRITHAKDGLSSVDTLVLRSKGIVNSMMKRARKNRIIMRFIIVALLMMIFIIVYVKYIKKDDSSADDPANGGNSKWLDLRPHD